LDLFRFNKELGGVSKEHNHFKTSVRKLELAAQIILGLIGFL
jgi:hypothetical protein